MTRYEYNKIRDSYFAKYGGFGAWAQKFNFIDECEVNNGREKIGTFFRTEFQPLLNDFKDIDPFGKIFKVSVARPEYAPEIKKFGLLIYGYKEAKSRHEKMQNGTFFK